MKGFAKFVREDDAVDATLKKLPAQFRALVDGCDFRFEPSNTLAGDDGHVGEIDPSGKRKVVRVAGPWNYGREFVLLHEVGHRVWAKFVKGTPLEKEWSSLVDKNPKRNKEEGVEEQFCHAFACYFAKTKLVVLHHPTWMNFIKKISRDRG